MLVQLLDHTQNPVARIGRMAAICYDSKIDEASNIKRAVNCKTSGHLATMRFAYATVNVSGISRVCSHQIVRMAHAGILQRSQRYVKETTVQFVDPPALATLPQIWKDTWKDLQEAAEDLYLALVESGQMKKEDARYILPQGCATEMNLCLNFQGWKDFLHNRTTKHAQWEVREVALEIEKLLAGIAPEIFTPTKTEE